MAENSVARFKEKITKSKLLQSTYYKVVFDGVVGSKDNNFELGEFDLYCQGTDIPGKKLSTLEVKRHGFTLRMPGNMEYDGSWKTTVLMDLSLTGYKNLLKWVAYYSSFANDVGGERGFPSTTATITLLNNNYLEASGAGKIKIYGIFPTEVPALAMKQDASEYLNVDVTFAYSYTDDFSETDPVATGAAK